MCAAGMGGTNQRKGVLSVSSSLLSIPFSLISMLFFLLSFYGLSPSCPHNLLSLLFPPLLTKGWVMAPRGEVDMNKGGGKGMRIPDFLSPGRGTSTRSELNYLLYLPFFKWSLSLLCSHSSLFLLCTSFGQGVGYAPKGRI